MLNQNTSDLGILNRFNLDPSRSSADDATHAQRKAHCPVKFMQESRDSQPPAQEVEAAEAKASSVDFVT
jgi:hypothetical protein